MLDDWRGEHLIRSPRKPPKPAPKLKVPDADLRAALQDGLSTRGAAALLGISHVAVWKRWQRMETR